MIARVHAQADALPPTTRRACAWCGQPFDAPEIGRKGEVCLCPGCMRGPSRTALRGDAP